MLLQRTILVLLVTLLVSHVSVYGQSTLRSKLSIDPQLSAADVAQSTNEPEEGNDLILAGQVMAALKRLEANVLVYRSLGDFEANGRIARVSYEVFQKELEDVTAEVEPMLCRLKQIRLKMELSNALCSYRDGGFWWSKIHQSRVVKVSAMNFAEATATPSEAVLMSTVPYTIACHWRQAAKSLRQAGKLMKEMT